MNNLEVAQKKMVNMLNVFHNICLKLNIKYWCLGGTLIGAVRHSGFIPWDGDLDVAMLSDDFKIFEKHIQDELPSTMYYFGHSLDGLYKIRDLYSKYLKQQNTKRHHGLQLDIFLYNVIDTNISKNVVSVASWLAIHKENCFKYDDIFPVKNAKFNNIDVFIPNNVEDVCKHSYGGYPPPFPKKELQYCHEGPIDPINPAPYYLILFKDIYKLKTQQWFSESATKQNIPLHHMAGWIYITQEEWDKLCEHFLHGIDLNNSNNLFDAGCGVGALFNYVNNINDKIKLYGCDLNQNMVNKCRLLFPSSHVDINDIIKLNNYQTEYFDNAVCISTLSYLVSLEEVELSVKELLRIVKPKGRINLCFLTDNEKGLKSFTIMIPKSFWCLENFKVSEIKVVNMDFPKCENRYSVFIEK